MKRIAFLLALTFFTVWSIVANRDLKAQGSGGALVVVTCGTLPLAYTAGSTRALTVNTNGQVCQ